MMDLKTFIAETLQQICDDGIREAQSKEGGRAINAEGAKMQSGHLIDAGSYGIFTRVDFDVAVSAESVGGAKGEIKVWGIGDIEGGAERKAGQPHGYAEEDLPDGAKSQDRSFHRELPYDDLGTA